ncbi:hypothetical protein RIF23_20345 [Lipingzhangella sp. LS1_29]|uniref:Uncharacterized protein n=1 Tax=Lipingzhangella rawalii TaxID=2055835 RepID=A0ABU2HBI0_9ACTN|nr:hypothetical protein [Lipingzhangella rawalii]MDS1272641.1 hypothetical protein [Lipingzhangella rawalii]
MSERVDWASMTDEEFLALARHAVETPSDVDGRDDDTDLHRRAGSVWERRAG